jgi:hypothetical protein
MHPSRTRDQFSLNFFAQLRGFYFVAPSLTRGRVCNLVSLQGLARAVPLGSESRGTQDHILLLQFLTLPRPGGPGFRIYIPQKQGIPVIPPGTGFPFRSLLRLAGLRWRYSNPACTRMVSCCSSVRNIYGDAQWPSAAGNTQIRQSFMSLPTILVPLSKF